MTDQPAPAPVSEPAADVVDEPAEVTVHDLHAERAGHYWSVSVKEPGVYLTATFPRLDKAIENAREKLAEVLEVEVDEVVTKVRFDLGQVNGLLSSLAEAEHELETARFHRDELRRGVIRALLDDKVALADVSAVVGLSAPSIRKVMAGESVDR